MIGRRKRSLGNRTGSRETSRRRLRHAFDTRLGLAVGPVGRGFRRVVGRESVREAVGRGRGRMAVHAGYALFRRRPHPPSPGGRGDVSRDRALRDTDPESGGWRRPVAARRESSSGCRACRPAGCEFGPKRRTSLSASSIKNVVGTAVGHHAPLRGIAYRPKPRSIRTHDGDELAAGQFLFEHLQHRRRQRARVFDAQHFVPFRIVDARHIPRGRKWEMRGQPPRPPAGGRRPARARVVPRRRAGA